tara:strand:+ start:2570 stop:3826 length:1257 start_codon:yes stop_codon:yes gene_type:complete
MSELIGWVFKGNKDNWEELYPNDKEYIEYIDNIINNHDSIKTNYYLTKDIDNSNKIIYIDKPVEFKYQELSNDLESSNYLESSKYLDLVYNKWKENLIIRLNNIITSQKGGGPKDFIKWIKNNKELYLYDSVNTLSLVHTFSLVENKTTKKNNNNFEYKSDNKKINIIYTENDNDVELILTIDDDNKYNLKQKYEVFYKDQKNRFFANGIPTLISDFKFDDKYRLTNKKDDELNVDEPTSPSNSIQEEEEDEELNKTSDQNNSHGYIYYSKIDDNDDKSSDGSWNLINTAKYDNIIQQISTNYEDKKYYIQNKINISFHFYPYIDENNIYIYIKYPDLSLINNIKLDNILLEKSESSSSSEDDDGDSINNKRQSGGRLVKLNFGKKNKNEINQQIGNGIKFIKAKKSEKSKLDKHLKK